jgi:hypothetical protein
MKGGPYGVDLDYKYDKHVLGEGWAKDIDPA